MKTLGLLLSTAALAGVIGPPPVPEAAPASAVAIGAEATNPLSVDQPSASGEQAASGKQVTSGDQAASSEQAYPADRAAAGQRRAQDDQAASGTGCAGAQVVRAVYLRRFGGSPVVGRVRVRKDSCARYWAEVIMYQRVPVNAVATAYLTRYEADGKVSRWSCADGGATAVLAGQTTCRSPKVPSAGDTATFIASAQELHDGGGGYARVSWGQTGRTR